MHKPLLAALLCGVLLSGCADSGGDDLGASGSGLSSSASLTSTGPPPKPVVYSDTLHFLAAPDMTLVVPLSSSDIETPTDTAGGGFFGGGGGGNREPQSQWSYQATANSSINGATVHVWIKIVENLVQSPASFPPGAQPCTWYVSVAIGADSDDVTECLSEPAGIIAPGIKELVFDMPSVADELETNETVTVTFGRTVFSASPDNAVFILSGTPEHDSRVILANLKEAVPEALAAQA